jgi:hypothetical protein
MDLDHEPGLVWVSLAIQPLVVSEQSRIDRLIPRYALRSRQLLPDARDRLGYYRRLADPARREAPRRERAFRATPDSTIPPIPSPATRREENVGQHAVAPLSLEEAEHLFLCSSRVEVTAADSYKAAVPENLVVVVALGRNRERAAVVAVKDALS